MCAGRMKAAPGSGALLVALASLLAAACHGVRVQPAWHGEGQGGVSQRSRESHTNALEDLLEAMPHLRDNGAPRVSTLREGSVEVSVNATLLQENGEWVRVSWDAASAVAAPLGGKTEDWVLVMLGADSDLDKDMPVKGFKIGPSPAPSGGLDARMYILGEGASQHFLFTRLDPEAQTWEVLGRSGDVGFADLNAPVGLSLALTGEANEMAAGWQTHGGAEGYDPVCTIKAAGGSEEPREVFGRSSTYSRGDMCGPPASELGWVDPGTFHRVTFSQLAPNVAYSYSCGSKSFGFSEPRTFRAPPTAEDKVHILAIADLGEFPSDGSMDAASVIVRPAAGDTIAAVSSLVGEAVDGDGPNPLVLINGDLSYARGFGAIWDYFGTQLEPLASRAPVMTVIGNHERDWPASGDRFDSFTCKDSGGECGVPYARRFPMPGSHKGQHFEDEPWYSFDHGPVHFLQLSSEHVFSNGSLQNSFAYWDLKGVNRELTPYVVVSFHRPMYINSDYSGPNYSDISVMRDLQYSFEAMFMEHGVDLVIMGHHHTYQRMCAVFKGKCVGDGERAPTYVVVGHGGASFSVLPDWTPPEWVKKQAKLHGYLKIEVDRQEMKLTSINSEDGTLIDAFSIKARAL